MICKRLDIPVSTAESIVRKWKLHHITQTATTQSPPSKFNTKTRQSHSEDNSHSTVAESGEKVHQRNISGALHNLGLYGKMARKKPFLRKSHVKARV